MNRSTEKQSVQEMRRRPSRFSLSLIILLAILGACWFGIWLSQTSQPEISNSAVATKPDADQDEFKPKSAMTKNLMTENEAFDGLDPDCPAEVRKRQILLEIKYWGFDDQIHDGQIIVDQDLKQDVEEVFQIALEHRFPIRSIIPMSHPSFRENGRWSDDRSMAANNSSGFNYRLITGGTTLSKHALGRAIDINPRQNPYIKTTDQGIVVLPPGATYDPQMPGTLSADHPVTQALIARGWNWGGNWTRLKDYQHFEKPTEPQSNHP